MRVLKKRIQHDIAHNLANVEHFATLKLLTCARLLSLPSACRWPVLQEVHMVNLSGGKPW